jgi:hypothetical protein
VVQPLEDVIQFQTTGKLHPILLKHQTHRFHDTQARSQKEIVVWAARDFAAGESLGSQEYFVYFKNPNCTNATKDPAHADKIFSECAQ